MTDSQYPTYIVTKSIVSDVYHVHLEGSNGTTARFWGDKFEFSDAEKDAQMYCDTLNARVEQAKPKPRFTVGNYGNLLDNGSNHSIEVDDLVKALNYAHEHGVYIYQHKNND